MRKGQMPVTRVTECPLKFVTHMLLPSKAIS